MLSIRSEANVAIPATADTVVVPDSVPPAGLVPIVTSTLLVKPGTTFPRESCAATRTAGEIGAPVVVVLGCTANTSFAGVEGLMSNASLVVPVSAVAAAERV